MSQKPKVLHRGPEDEGRVFPMGVLLEKTPVGLGVFSCAFIPKETAIGRVRGEIVKGLDYTSDYCIDAGDDLSLEPVAPFCYINHSCEPNCALMQYVKEEELDGTELEGALSSTSEDEYEPEEECYYGDDETAWNEDAEYEDEEEIDDPESEFLDEEHSDEAHGIEIWVESLRDILPGEQLTIDYSWPAERAMRCACGSPNCRGWIVDPEELDELSDRES